MSSAQEPEGDVGGPDVEDDDVDDELDLDEDDDFDDEDDEDEDDLDDDDDDDDDDEDDDLDDEEDDDEDIDDEDEVDDQYEPGDVNAIETAPYEAGDVNTVTAPAGRASGTAGGTRNDMPITVLDYLARAMADDPDAVVVRKEERRGSTILRLRVAQRDMGRVIGRRGRTAQAIRTLVAVAGAREGVQTVVDIDDD